MTKQGPIPLYVDFNAREPCSRGRQSVALRFHCMNPPDLEDRLEPGLVVTVYDEEIQCRGTVRWSDWMEEWIADLISGTVEDLQPGDFESLRASTNRAAISKADGSLSDPD